MEGDLKQKLLRRRKEEEEEEEEELSLAKRVWNESKVMWIVAAPAIFTRFSTFGISVISQAFVGHIGSKELAAYALVFTVLIRFANGVLVLFSSPKTLLFFLFFLYKKSGTNYAACVVLYHVLTVFLCCCLTMFGLVSRNLTNQGSNSY